MKKVINSFSDVCVMSVGNLFSKLVPQCFSLDRSLFLCDSIFSLNFYFFNFRSAIEEGKGIYNNIKNFVRFQLST